MSENTNPAPLPCPFCGFEHVGFDGLRVSCDACNADGPTADTEAEAVAAWNRRSAAPWAPAADHEQADAWRAVFDELSKLPGWADVSGTGAQRAISMIRRLAAQAMPRE